MTDQPDKKPAEKPPMLTVPDMIRAAIAGTLMGIANLIPGVSGGTMILAMGVYGEFIDGVADITALRFSMRRIVFLGIVGLCAGTAIVSLSGVILALLFNHTIAMFALFIGLTLGGAPLLLKTLQPWCKTATVSVIAGVLVMVGVVMLRAGTGFPKNTGMDLASGVIGSTTMVLPGISGSYMLLVLDQYDRVVGSVRELKDALKGGDRNAFFNCMKVVVPVGIGAIVGIVVLSNVLKWLLHRRERATIGVLLGLLLGSVLGLWPFSKSAGEKALEGQPIEEIRAYAERWQLPGCDGITDKDALIEHVTDHAVWAKHTAPPITGGQIGLALAMIAVGFVGTSALSRIGGGKPAANA